MVLCCGLVGWRDAGIIIKHKAIPFIQCCRVLCVREREELSSVSVSCFVNE